MNQDFIFAFVVMPLIVVAMGYASLKLNDWDLRRRRKNGPAK